MMLRIILGIVIGGGLGWGWHKLAGCPTGACPLTRYPLVTTLYGAVLGALLATSLH
jgi:hypothetical protein